MKKVAGKVTQEEVEVKVLNVRPLAVERSLKKLGAKKIQSKRLRVFWYRKIGWGRGNDEWFLRVRSYGTNKHEVTWKAKSKVDGISRRHKEINLLVSDRIQVEQLFVELGLEKYAYQEKDRTSWVLGRWRFDLDKYPKMPPYLEIEGRSDSHIREALKLLGLEKNETSSEGETSLIKGKYGLDWDEMRF